MHLFIYNKTPKCIVELGLSLISILYLGYYVRTHTYGPKILC
jgi:hypothetical protein